MYIIIFMIDRKGLRKFTNFERLLEQDPSGRIMQVRLTKKKKNYIQNNYTIFQFQILSE